MLKAKRLIEVDGVPVGFANFQEETGNGEALVLVQQGVYEGVAVTVLAVFYTDRKIQDFSFVHKAATDQEAGYFTGSFADERGYPGLAQDILYGLK